ncbi:hypothetical protein DFH07DRAFT_800973 [Mycena maculata]|uniref:Uncharacterized protein n=1 Tax=Mycena maculata TaxID=230809 RepID=A0AAD7JYA7_9AGAR|nr:hypothetical protein DFH07DRAFT_800973 [Mycena maculata]
MSIWSTARRNAIFQARAFSSAGNVVRQSNAGDISPEKMRALIAMYHQAETFVTRDNLKAKIDEAFTRQDRTVATEHRSLTLGDFEFAVRRRERAPTVTEWNAIEKELNRDIPEGGTMSIWSNPGAPRDLKMIEALYGVETLGSTQGKRVAMPGWDVLNDNESLFETSAKEDRERYEESDF